MYILMLHDTRQFFMITSPWSVGYYENIMNCWEVLDKKVHQEFLFEILYLIFENKIYNDQLLKQVFCNHSTLIFVIDFTLNTFCAQPFVRTLFAYNLFYYLSKKLLMTLRDFDLTNIFNPITEFCKNRHRNFCQILIHYEIFQEFRKIKVKDFNIPFSAIELSKFSS